MLQSVSGKSKTEIVRVFGEFLGVPLFQIKHAGAVRLALSAAEAASGGVADHIIGQVNLAAGCTRTVIFDKRLHRAPAFAVL